MSRPALKSSRSQLQRRLQVEPLERRELMATAPFTIAVLPDTQIYTQSYPATFDKQTKWIVDNRTKENLVFVTHEGDIVQSAERGSDRNLVQWQRADHSIDILDGDLTQNPNGLIPYSVAIGNHDYGDIGDKAAGASRYRQFFGAGRYEGRTWYGGHSPSGLSHYQIFDAGDWQFMNFALEWEPGPAEVVWAQKVIDEHPGLPTIITTHSYLNDATKKRTTDSTNTGPSMSGEELFQKLVKPNSQVFLVLNGHFSGEYNRTVTNAAGQQVFEMVTDFQSDEGGGQGYMPLVTFDPDAKKIRVRTYSPLLDKFQTDNNSQYTLNFDLRGRFGTPAPPPTTQPTIQTTTFRNGEFGYWGNIDTQLRQKNATASFLGSSLDLLVDAASASEKNVSQVLTRFNDIIGNGARQVPRGATILSAELVLTTLNPGDGGSVRRMAKDWFIGSTWNSLKNGVSADNEEALETFTAQVGEKDRSPNVPEGATIVNVTADVQAWANGTSNNGWAMLPWSGGTDGWGFAPSDVSQVNLRPQLRIEWVQAGGAEISSFQDGRGSYSGTVDTHLALNEPTSRHDENINVVVDGPTDGTTRTGLLKFDEIFGTANSQIPAGAQILWARLILTTPSGVTNAAGAGAKLHRMLKPWTDSATWNNSFGGNGIQVDGKEARATADLNTGVREIGTRSFDVTAALRDWESGTANHGWAFQFNSSDAWMFGSSEQEGVLNRPRLVVAWKPAGA